MLEDESLTRQNDELQRLVASSADVLGALGDRQGVLQAAVRAGDEMLDVTARRDRELAATIRALPPFLRQLRTTSRTITAASGDLNGATSALLPVAPLVRPTLAEINAAAPEFRGLFRELPPTLRAGNRGLPSLTRILRAAPSALSELRPTARELIPFMQLFAVNRTATYSTFANVGTLLNGTMVGPQGKVRRYGPGIATVWNETLSGWKNKLPTNRQNPYPKPDSLLDVARIGQLKAYDCRNTGNPLYLAPTGTGSPPCLLQGPWEFRGKNRFYPRLELGPER
jgi:ABC-type transporter Mla subunit MlaD